MNYTFTPSKLLRDYGDRKLSKIRFLHLPKTGTTFAATVVHYGCDNLDGIYIDVLIKLNTAELQPWKLDKSCRNRIINSKRSHSSRNGNWWPHKPFYTEDKG